MMAQALLVGSRTTWLTVKVASSKNEVTCGAGARPLVASSTSALAAARAASAWRADMGDVSCDIDLDNAYTVSLIVQL